MKRICLLCALLCALGCFSVAFSENAAFCTVTDFEKSLGVLPVGMSGSESYLPARFSKWAANSSEDVYRFALTDSRRFTLICDNENGEVLSAQLQDSSYTFGLRKTTDELRQRIASVATNMVAALCPGVNPEDSAAVADWFYTEEQADFSRKVTIQNYICTLDVSSDIITFKVYKDGYAASAEEHLSPAGCVGPLSISPPDNWRILVQDEYNALCYPEPFIPGCTLVYIQNRHYGAYEMSLGHADIGIDFSSIGFEKIPCMLDGYPAYKYLSENSGVFTGHFAVLNHDFYTTIDFASPNPTERGAIAELDILLHEMFAERLAG